MKKVVYNSPFVPAEWIAAHGLRPSRIIPEGTEKTQGPGICPFAQAFGEAIRSDSQALAAVLTTTCDQVRRASEAIAQECTFPVFLLNVPATWQSPVAHRMYAAEIRRLGRFLVQLGGKPPSPDELTEVMKEYDAARREILSLQGRLKAVHISHALLEFQRRGTPEVNVSLLPREAPGAGRPGGVPLALLGGPLLEGDFEMFHLAERFGGEIVLDATDSGERMLPLPLDRRQLREDPLAELARIYFSGLPDVFRRPNSELYRWLRRELDVRQVRGIILRRHPWCDLWHAEVYRLRGWLNLPILEIDLSGVNGTRALLAGKMQSFLESIR